MANPRPVIGLSIAVAVALGLGVAACSSSGSGGAGSSAVPVATAVVDLPPSYRFAPEAISVAAGTTVTWTNNDPVPHTVTDVNQAWDSGLFDQGTTFSRTFTEPGTYDYYCIPHPMMIGKVVVTG